MLIVAVTMLAVVPFLIPLASVQDMPIPTVAWVIVALSAFANVGIIYYHWTTPAHPKFVVVPFRKFVIRVHILSGTAELLLGLAALLTRRPEFAIAMAGVALLFHIPSAFHQTTIVFGSRAIMRPAYLACVGLHAFTAIQLLRFPSSELWLVATFLIFNIYVWVRVYYFIFQLTGMLGSAKYSVAVLAAGLTTVPVVLGPSTIFLIATAVMVHYVMYRALILEPTTGALHDFVRERARDVAVNDEVLALYPKQEGPEDDEAAAAYFKVLDRDGSGFLDAQELRRALAAWSVPEAIVHDLMARHSLPEHIDLSTFRKTVWSIGHIREKARQFTEIAGAQSDQDRAGLVFRRIDLDGDGYVSRFELEVLLIEWGLPPSDVDRWLKIADADGDGRITRADFYERLEPVWRFVYYVVVEGHDEEYSNVRRAVFGEAEDLRRMQEIRGSLQSERLSGVGLFAGGGPAFIEDVAAGMVAEQHPAGHVLFREGERGRTFYFIASGRVLITSAGERLAELGAGASFGEGALLSAEVRNATATIQEDTVLYGISRDTFNFLVERHPVMRAHLEQLDRERRDSPESRDVAVSLLGRIPLFEGVSNLEGLAARAERRSVAAGTVLLKEGSAGHEALVVVSGAVRVVSGGDTLAELQEGALVGEGAVLTGDPRSADVIASRPTTVLVLMRDALLAEPTIVERLTVTHGERQHLEKRRLVRQQQRQELSALSTVPEDRVDEIADAFVPVVVRDGDALFREGDPGDRLYIVHRGTIRIERQGRPIARIGPGGCFGELAFLSDGVRSAAAVSDGVSEVFALDKRVYSAVVGSAPGSP